MATGQQYDKVFKQEAVQLVQSSEKLYGFGTSTPGLFPKIVSGKKKREE